MTTWEQRSAKLRTILRWHTPMRLQPEPVLLLASLAALGRSSMPWQEDEHLTARVAQASLDQCTIHAVAHDHTSAGPELFNLGRPLLLTQLAHSWPAVSDPTRRWSKPRLRELAEGAFHGVRWPVGQRAFGLVGADCRLGSYLSSVMEGAAASGGPAGFGSPLLFGRTHVGIAEEDWSVPELFARRQLSSRVLSVGPSGAGLALHNHGEAFEAVVVGRKLVLFLPPLPHDRGSRTSAATEAARLRLLSVPVGELVALPDGQRDALLIAAGWNASDLTSCLLAPGDAIWIPCNYYHGTMNIGDTVALGGQYRAAQESPNKVPPLHNIHVYVKMIYASTYNGICMEVCSYPCIFFFAD